MNFYLICFVAYLFGAVPFSVIIGNVFYRQDVRNSGSGNPGATNALRTLGWKAGLTVLILDMAKGFIPVMLAGQFYSEGMPVKENGFAVLVAFLAIAGHITSPFLRFKGGKGVATALGCIIALQPWYAVVIILAFVLIVWFTRYVSLGSIFSLAVYVGLNFLFNFFSLSHLAFSTAIAAIITFKHRENIKRLLTHSESKLELFKKKSSGI